MLSFDRQGAAASSRGCPFSTRCPYVIKGTCDTHAPPMRRFPNGHVIACHLTPEQLAAMKPLGAAPEKAAAPSQRPAPLPAPGPMPKPQMAPVRVAAPAPVAPPKAAPPAAPSRAPVRLSATASLAGHQTTPVSGFSATSAKARTLPQAANSVVMTAPETTALPRPKGLPATAALARQQLTAFSAQALAARPVVPVGPPALPSEMAAPAPVLQAPSAPVKRLPATAALARQQATSFSAEAVATKR